LSALIRGKNQTVWNPAESFERFHGAQSGLLERLDLHRDGVQSRPSRARLAWRRHGIDRLSRLSIQARMAEIQRQFFGEEPKTQLLMS